MDQFKHKKAKYEKLLGKLDEMDNFRILEEKVKSLDNLNPENKLDKLNFDPYDKESATKELDEDMLSEMLQI